MIPEVSLSDSYRIPVRRALAWSVIMAALSALLLDRGQTARLTAFGLLVFWACVLMTICRRPTNPTRFDLLLIGWGSWAVVFGFQALMQVLWHLRGLE
jgi:hypothetical protein